MTKDEIQKRIYELTNDDEIKKFIDERILELETKSEERTVGQNYTDSFQDYISSKTHYKAADNFKEKECPDLVYDDVTPYINLIKSIQESGKKYSELTVFRNIFFEVYKYLPSGDISDRYDTYYGHINKRLSIKTVSDSQCAFCSEKAGMAHNMFKFLGMDSEVIGGSRNNIYHAYNMVYPNGYENEPMVLYDPSFFVDFKKDDDKLSFAFYKVLKKDMFTQLRNGEPITIDLSSTEAKYREMYGDLFDGYSFSSEDLNPIYVYGLEVAKKYRSEQSKEPRI